MSHFSFLYLLMTLPANKLPLHPGLFCWETFAPHQSCIDPCRVRRCHLYFYFVSKSLCCMASSKSQCLFPELPSFLRLLQLHPMNEFLHHTFLQRDVVAE